MTVYPPHSPPRKKNKKSIIGFLVFFGLLWIFIMIDEADRIPQLNELTWMGAVKFGLGLVLFLFFIYLLNSSSFFDQFKFRSFRASMIYAICLALAFSNAGFFINSDNKNLFLAFYFFGGIAGILFGWAYIRVMKRKIVNDKILIPGTFPENMQYKDYWKGLVLLFVCWGTSLFLARGVFHSKDAHMGTLAGMFMGMCMYMLIWVYFYEKRNELHLTFEYINYDLAVTEAHS